MRDPKVGESTGKFAPRLQRTEFPLHVERTSDAGCRKSFRRRAVLKLMLCKDVLGRSELFQGQLANLSRIANAALPDVDNLLRDHPRSGIVPLFDTESTKGLL